MIRVVVQGLGFVGSAMAVGIAKKKDLNGKNIFSVTGVDLPNNEGIRRINSINKGEPHFHTDDVELKKELYNAVKQTKNLQALFDFHWIKIIS